jgi:hypothetical protein
MQELPTPSGIVDLQAELTTDSTSNAAKSPGRENCTDHKELAITAAPSAMMAYT